MHTIYDILMFFFQYIHNGHDTLSDSFTLVARTRTKTSVPAAVRVQVLPVNDQLPILVNNTKLEMWAGATVVITNDILGTIVQHFLYRSDHICSRSGDRLVTLP